MATGTPTSRITKKLDPRRRKLRGIHHVDALGWGIGMHVGGVPVHQQPQIGAERTFRGNGQHQCVQAPLRSVAKFSP